MPYYFVAIHNEPSNKAPVTEASYEILKQYVQAADEYGISLTLMFGASWADLLTDAERSATIEQWRLAGHEIAMHHHGVYHMPGVDGYTGIPMAEVGPILTSLGFQADEFKYKGDLDDLMAKLAPFGAVNSGCANDEEDKRELPDAIVYDTCSGFANSGAIGTKKSDKDPTAGRNDYVLTATYNGIPRSWLSHQTVGGMSSAKQAQKSYGETAVGSVYGFVAHSTDNNTAGLLSTLAFLHEQDPTGSRSRTLREVVDQELLPSETLPADKL